MERERRNEGNVMMMTCRREEERGEFKERKYDELQKRKEGEWKEK